MKGFDLCKKLEERTGIPLIFNVIPKHLKQIENKIDNIFVLQNYYCLLYTSKGDFSAFINSESRHTSLALTFPDVAKELFEKTEEDAKERYAVYKQKAEQ